MSGQDPDPDSKRPTWLGIYDRPGRPSVTGIEIAAAALSLIWLVVAVVFLVCVFRLFGHSGRSPVRSRKTDRARPFGGGACRALLPGRC